MEYIDLKENYAEISEKYPDYFFMQKLDIDAEKAIESIEGLSETNPFKYYWYRPHATIMIPSNEEWASESEKYIKSTINNIMKPLTDDYLTKIGVNSFTPRKNIIVSRMSPGKEHPPHWDSADTYVMEVYLNNVVGGDLVFPDLGIKFSPEPGMFIIFKGLLKHGVSELISGDRYSFGSGYIFN
jgi:hypothetical protein